MVDRGSIQQRDTNRLWEIETILFRYNEGDLSRYAAMTLDWNGSQPSPLREDDPPPSAGNRRRPRDGAAGQRPVRSAWRPVATLRFSPACWWACRRATPQRFTLRGRPAWHGSAATAWRASPQSVHARDFDPVGGRGIGECFLMYLVADELGLVDEATRTR